MGVDVISLKIAMLAILMLLGFIAVKTKYVNVNLKDALSKLVLYFTLPLLNLTAITGQTLQLDMLKNAGLLILIEVSVVLVLLLIGTLTARIFHLPAPTRVIHTCRCPYSDDLRFTVLVAGQQKYLYYDDVNWYVTSA